MIVGGLTLAAVGGGIGFWTMPAVPETQAAQTAPSARSAPARPSSVAIRTADVDATVRWYVDKLGFRQLSEAATVQGSMVVLERDSVLLEVEESAPDQSLARSPDLDVETTAAVGMAPITLAVRDVDAEVKRLKKQGAEVVGEPEDALDERSRVAYVRDNGGRTIELREPLEEISDGFHGEGR